MRPVRYRVPRESGSLLCVPDLGRWPELLERNRQQLSSITAQIGGFSISEFRRLARSEFLSTSSDFLRSFGHFPANLDASLAESARGSVHPSSFIPHPSSEVPLIVVGHQTSLFHPGVWIKNFVAAGLASLTKGFGVSVLIDNDTIKQTAIPVPAGTPDAPLLAHIAFDRWEAEVPFEERSVIDEEVFHRFGESVRDSMCDYPFEPMIQRYWKAVADSCAVTANLGQRLAAGRRSLERQMSCSNFEVPLSRLCDGKAFGLFTSEILIRREDYLEFHNTALAEFRRINRIRSRHHPVPMLEREDGWTEVPLWIWSSDQPTRQRLFARQVSGAMELRAGTSVNISLPCRLGDAGDQLADALQSALGTWKIRPRALTTTFFLRLALADLFIHGVGGAKYDELTDEIIRRFLGISPPATTVLSATALLDVGQIAFDEQNYLDLSRRQRDLYWNPDRYIAEPLREHSPVSDWIERKHELRESANGKSAEKTKKFEEYRQLNRQLRQYLGTQPQEIEDEWTKLHNARRGSQLLSSREFSFCLHPFDSLERLFRPMLDFGRFTLS